ncbi:MAG: hypothetical protein MJ208_03170 [Bacilli bacterium]|nr:hypothetical protein [Bacilli bacterium]
MKKIKLLVAPLLSVAFLVSCGGGDAPTPSVDIHIVSEQEFNDACSFKGVQYVQSNLISEDDNDTYTCLTELSPTVSHMINESTSPSYYEIFTRKNNDDTYEKATREDKDEKKYDFENTYESEFITTESETVNVLKQLKHVGLSYKSFAYNDKEGTYSATFTPESSKTPVTTTLKFENKILISDENKGAAGGNQSTTFTYETKTPRYPKYTLTFYENDRIKVVDTKFVTADKPMFNAPEHDGDGTWKPTKDGIQDLNPGESVTIPEEGLDDYDFVWTPETSASSSI